MAKPIRRHNRGYSGGYPIAVGDRYYAQDIFRDQAHLESAIGIAYNDLTKETPPYILNGLVCSQGVGHTMDITAGKAVAAFTVTIPDTAAAWTLPPTTTTANISSVLDYAGGTNLSLAGCTTDGATPNYVKLKYAETNGNTRNRAKKAGSYAYEVYDTVTVTIDAVAPVTGEVNAATFTTNGAAVTFTNAGDRRLRSGVPYHQYDYVVFDQTSFNGCLTRVAANQYKFNDTIKSIYFANYTGGYLMYGATSPLSGGDTWGYIQTISAINIIFEKGAYIQMGNTEGYFDITGNAYVLNAEIRGLGTVASAIQYSFYISGNNAYLENCTTSTRSSNTGMTCFYVANTGVLLNQCLAYNITSSGYVYGFRTGNSLYDNIISCTAFLLSSTGGEVRGFNACSQISDCVSQNLSSSTNHAYGFYLCDRIENSRVIVLDHSGAVAAQNAYGFYQCNYMSSCYANDVDTNGAGGEATGFKECNDISSSLANDCNSYGYADCEEVSTCKSTANGVYGFAGCNNLSSCTANLNTIRGFNLCNELAACLAESNGTFGFSDCYRISVSQALNNGTWGFNSSRQLHSNYANGNPSGKYQGCFADFAGANAVADTAAGGYNA